MHLYFLIITLNLFTSILSQQLFKNPKPLYGISKVVALFIFRYKEKLQTKYLKASANRISSVGTCFRFSSANLDESSLSLGDRGCVSPVVFHDTPKQKSTNSGPKAKKGLSKEHACFSKQMTRKQIRREYVAAVEKKLQQRPLATFPHYKEHMTPQVSGDDTSLDDQSCNVSEPRGQLDTSGGVIRTRRELTFKGGLFPLYSYSTRWCPFWTRS